MNKRTKFLLGIGVIAALVIGFQVVAFASHVPPTLSPSTFEIDDDANLKVDHASGTKDWATPESATFHEIRQADLPTGSTDDSFKGGVKENTECPGQVTGSIPGNKSDLLTFHAYTEPGSGTHPGFLNVAWSRVSQPSGTTLMDFELNQKRTPCGGGSPNVVRTDGDKLIEYAIDQGGARAEISARTWNATTHQWSDPATDVDTPSAVCGGSPCAVGTINRTAIPANESDGLGAKAERTFGEAQLDLRFLLQGANANSCTGFGSAMLKSRASDQDTTQLKDFIKSTNIDVNTCGTVTIIKQTSPRGGNQEFPFTSTMPATATDTQTGATETCANFSLNDNGNTGTTNSAANTQTCTVLPGQYTVTEGADQGNYVFKTPNGVTCTASAGSTGAQDATTPNSKQVNINIASGGLVTCTYVNVLKVTNLTSLQSFFPNDSVTISGSNLTFTGSVTFKLHKGTLDTGETCGSTDQTDPVKYTQTVLSGAFTTDANGNKVAKTTNGDGVDPEFPLVAADAGQYYWEIFYDGPAGGDPDVRSCVENSTVSPINNGGTV